MKQYLDLCKSILDNGEWKEPARENMPRTKSLFGTRLEFDMGDGFPLATTKKMHYKGIITELLWFIKGDTNIKYLVDNGCNIWNSDCYKFYKLNAKNRGFDVELSFEDFITIIKSNNIDRKHTSFDKNYASFLNEFAPLIQHGHWDGEYVLGDLGNVYGHNWRYQNGVDQLKVCIDRIINEPMGRYAIIDAWNPSDYGKSALMPCHLLYQFNCVELSISERLSYLENLKPGKNPGYELGRSDDYYVGYCDDRNIPKYHLDLQMYQRSVDTALGAPYNLASASILLHLIAKLVGMTPRKFVWVGGDTHIYENHIEQIKEQLKRTPMDLSELVINKDIKTFEDLVNLQPSDITIKEYKSHPAIKMELKTGL